MSPNISDTSICTTITRRRPNLAALLLGAALAASPLLDGAQAAGSDHRAAQTLSAQIAGNDGASHGTVTAKATASGAVEIDLDLTDLPAGAHAVHIHETGDCSASDFKSAGGHLTGGKDHGAYAEGGMHSGDLPNIQVGEDGVAQVTYFSRNVTLDQIMDDDGSAFVIHAGADDYVSQPSGDAGARIGCGVFETAES